MDLAYSSLNHSDLTEQTYIVLRDNILKRKFEPGQKISVEEVARQLGVSRTPVMDALKPLAADGLVEIVPRRGTFVTELDAQAVAELFDIRVMMETYAADHILSTSGVGPFLAAIEAPLLSMEQATVEDDYADYEAFMAGDRDLHLRLVEQTGNERLVHMYSDLNVHIQIARAHCLSRVEDARQAHQEHQAIVHAFRAGEAEAACQALETHITNVKIRMLELLEDRGGKL